MQPGVHDEAIRREVLATLKVNPAASLETLLGNWQYHRHGLVEEAETASVTTILQEERAASIERELTGDHRAWWRLW
jgi:hypothetical protein